MKLILIGREGGKHSFDRRKSLLAAESGRCFAWITIKELGELSTRKLYPDANNVAPWVPEVLSRVRRGALFAGHFEDSKPETALGKLLAPSRGTQGNNVVPRIFHLLTPGGPQGQERGCVTKYSMPIILSSVLGKY